MACKGDNLPERPHRLSQLLGVPSTLENVTRQQLEELAALLPDPGNGHTSRGMPQAVPFDLPQWIAPMGCPWCQKGHGSNQATVGCSTPAPGIVPIPISPPLSCSLPVALLRPGAITTAATATTGMRYGIYASQGGRPARTSTSVATATLRSQARVLARAHVRTGAAGHAPPHRQRKEDAILDALPALATPRYHQVDTAQASAQNRRALPESE